MNGKYWAKVSKRGIIERKRAKIENPYLNAHVHINKNLHIYFSRFGWLVVLGLTAL